MGPRTHARNASNASVVADESHLKHKRRFCREEGCNRIVKSQGLCQRHGAKPRKCKVEGCDKQAQGNFDKMCKSHFKAMKRLTTPLPRVAQGKAPPAPVGFSVYDGILPASISYTSRMGTVMPLIAHLKEGFVSNKPPAWHRNEERSARGILPVENPATQLEGWERELVWMEILVLTGAPGVSFRHLARAWGRDKGFHTVLAQFICERQGDVQRKKRLAEKEEQMSSDVANEGKARGPAKKRRRLKKNANLAHDVSADIWDDSAYGDHITNEALAANIFDFSPKEFESATALQRWKHMEDNSDTASMTSERSMNSHAAAAALVGHGGKIMPKPSPANRTASVNEHPEQNPETSALVLTTDVNNSAPLEHSQYVTASADPAAPVGQMDSHGQQYQQSPHYDASGHQHQQQYGSNVHAGTGLHGPQHPVYERNQQQYDSTAHQQQGQFHQPLQQNQPQYDTGSHQLQQQFEQNEQHNADAHRQQGQFQQPILQTLPHYGGGGHQPLVQQGHQPQYEQNQSHYEANVHQQGQYHQPDTQQQNQVLYQPDPHRHVQQQNSYGQDLSQHYLPNHQQPLVHHGSPPIGVPNQYIEGTQQLRYVSLPNHLQNQAPYAATHPQPEQNHQQYTQQHGRYVAHGQEIELPASHQRNEHLELVPETGALPPELPHPHGHQQQYPLQQHENLNMQGGEGGFDSNV